MLRTLLSNTFASATAFAFVSVVGLLLVPLLIEAYGLAGFGLLALARLFLPSGMVGILDLGFSETATVVTARARAGMNKHDAAAQLTLLTIVAGTVGLLTGALLWTGAGLAAVSFHVPADTADSFASVLRWTALSLPVLLLLSVADGVLKGFELYKPLRSFDVATTAGYAVTAYYGITTGQGYEFVALAYVASTLGRALLTGSLALTRIAPLIGKPRRWTAADAEEIRSRCALMFQGRVLGTLQNQSSPLIIGALLGPVATGTYDVLVRLPRFAKMVLGLLNTALLPIAARLEYAEDVTMMARINTRGLLFVAVASLPPLATAAVFSASILDAWVGASFAALWPWQALMLIVPATNTLVGFGGTALLARTTAVVRLNRVLAAQVAVQLALSLATLSLWSERAFIFGQAAAAAGAFIAQMRIIFAEQRLATDLARRLLLLAALGVLLAVIPMGFDLPSLPGLAWTVAAGFWLLAYWAAAAGIVMTGPERTTIASGIHSVLLKVPKT